MYVQKYNEMYDAKLIENLDSLYIKHYTTISNVMRILKNNTILGSVLDVMEGETPIIFFGSIVKESDIQNDGDTAIYFKFTDIIKRYPKYFIHPTSNKFGPNLYFGIETMPNCICNWEFISPELQKILPLFEHNCQISFEESISRLVFKPFCDIGNEIGIFGNISTDSIVLIKINENDFGKLRPKYYNYFSNLVSNYNVEYTNKDFSRGNTIRLMPDDEDEQENIYDNIAYYNKKYFQ